MIENKPADTSSRVDIKGIVVALFGITAETLYPCLFIYFRNCFEVDIVDTIPAFLVLSVIGFALFGIFYLVLKNIRTAGGYAAAVQFILLNYGVLIRDNFNVTSVWFTLIPYSIAAIILISMVAIKKSKGKALHMAGEIGGIASLLFAVCFSVLIAFNAISAAPDIKIKLDNEKLIAAHKNNEQLDISISDGSGKPNIYYFFVDEYSSKAAFERYCGYDNSSFTDKLKSMNFNISDTSYSGTTSTEMIIARLMGLGGDIDYSAGAEERTAQSNQTDFFDILHSAGYTNVVIDYRNCIPTSSADYTYSDESDSMYSDRAEYYIYERTVFFDLYWRYFCAAPSYSRVESFSEQLSIVKEQQTMRKAQVLTFFYTDIVHGPWSFDKNGEPLPEEQVGYKWENPEYYIGQVEYFNDAIIPTLEIIMRDDPNSIIVIQSDHSFRGIFETEIRGGNTSIDQSEENRYMSNIFNAVYYKGEKYDIEGLSMVNTWIKIYNDELDEELPYADDIFVNRPPDDI